MNEDAFNVSIRKFLKRVGVTSQREVEDAVRKAIAEKRLTGTESLPVKVTFAVPALALSHEVEGELDLE